MRWAVLIVCWLVVPATQAQIDVQALSQQAVDAERRGDFPGAISAFQELIREGEDSPELRSNLGIAYFQVHQYGEAVRQFRLALAKNADSVTANLFSGLSLLKLERAKEAVLYLARARGLEPNSVEILLALAQAEVASNDLSRARALYEQINRLDSQNAQAWYGLGIVNRALAEQELKQGAGANREQARELMSASEEALAKAMQLDPDSVRAHMLLGESFRIAERYDQAVEEYQAATKQQPQLAAAWAGLAAACSAKGDDEQALEAAKRALALESRDAPTNALIAETLLRQGDSMQGGSYARRALELEPDLVSGHLVLAKIYLAQHQPEKALPELRLAAKNDTDGSANYLLATTLRQLGKREAATVAMQKYRQLHARRIGSSAGTP